MASPFLRIGARGSALSLAQTRQTRNALAAILSVDAEAMEIVAITTSGDRQQEGRLIETGGKGLFTKELDEALRYGRIDLAIHSLKDLPTRLPHDLTLACVPKREDPRDAFVSLKAKRLEDLPHGAVVGTASLRRQAQTLFQRRDLQIVTLRGNVDTRLRKLEDGVADATYLALAGLKRLGLEDRAASLLDPNIIPPAACQGALAITTRADDKRALDAVAPLQDHAARLEIEAERGFLTALDGSCRTPIAALGRYDGQSLTFIGETLTPDGAQRWRRDAQAAMTTYAEARALGDALGHEIRDEAGDALMREV
jgi:hydroxymethylbilane synthase